MFRAGGVEVEKEHHPLRGGDSRMGYTILTFSQSVQQSFLNSNSTLSLFLKKIYLCVCVFKMVQPSIIEIDRFQSIP
jgi:hypothetical protein